MEKYYDLLNFSPIFTLPWTPETLLKALATVSYSAVVNRNQVFFFFEGKGDFFHGMALREKATTKHLEVRNLGMMKISICLLQKEGKSDFGFLSS